MEAAKIPKVNARLYVIGDIHGRLDLLDRVIAGVHRDVDMHGPGALTVTLGDCIDRGPTSRGVLDRLIGSPFLIPCIALKGNHERCSSHFSPIPR
jgi:serine/threonine protein phosphatase 1